MLKVQRLSLRGVAEEMFVEALSIPNAIASDDDIVHPFKKLEDTCKELVPGSNPGRGAREMSAVIGAFFFVPQTGFELEVDFTLT
jgi:hypothetical protein